MVAPGTLAPYAWLLSAEKHVIDCPKMYLDGWYDHQPPVFEGSGSLTLEGSSGFKFNLHAKAADAACGTKALREACERPFDRTTALRLRCTDYAGTEWNAGWVRPALGQMHEDRWQLFGECLGLTTMAENVGKQNGVELAFASSPDLPFTQMLTTTAHLGDAEIGWRRTGGRHSMEFLGSKIEVGTQPWTNEVWISANTSELLRHPYLENWLSEPLRALRGQLIYPRLVARNLSDGRSHVWVRPAPAPGRSFGGCAVVLRDRSPATFWEFYEKYLQYVAQHREKDGSPSFEANLITQLHGEVIQARAAGSPWVIALAVASAIEGLVKTFPDYADKPPEFTETELSAAADVLAKLAHPEIARRLQISLRGLSAVSTRNYLKGLAAKGLVSKGAVAAWNRLRNKVAHGNLFDPWGTENEHSDLKELLELFYSLTAAAIGYETAPQKQPATGKSETDT